MKKLSLLFLIFLLWHSVSAQNHYARFESIDVQHYAFEIHLNDTSNCIEGETFISVKFLKPCRQLVLDLVEKETEETGMTVKSVISEQQKLEFSHTNNCLSIQLPKNTNCNEILEFKIKYTGTPADGLAISENKYGQRTFFGDNWPDRARHWLPTVDHPSDKATLEFLVYAPAHYEVISNGYLVEKKELNNNLEFTHWKEDIPLSTKLMVIGVADFVVGNEKSYNEIPVNAWVFAKNEKKGFHNYRFGTEALEYFSELIGPFSYEKLAHVQSKTRYGGMENAGCIFYHEGTGFMDRSFESLFAHEVAHQWFGNSATEQNWHHIWLSEGFATYLTHVYNQHYYGEEAFQNGLKNDRERVIKFAHRKLAPIIDTTVTEYIELLNTNSYQKASWVLHMLRVKLGDQLFFRGLRKYYSEFRNSTALTDDFREIMENVSNKNLQHFFQQWLHQPGHPVLAINWEQNGNKFLISGKQTQSQYLFTFDFEIEVHYKNGTTKTFSFPVNSKKFNATFEINSQVKEVVFDPEAKLLFELNS